MKSIDLYNSLHAIDDNILERSEAAIYQQKSSKRPTPKMLKQRLPAALIAAALAMLLMGAGVVAVIYGDSIQNWFTHYWEMITGQQMSDEQATIIDHLSQEIRLSQTVGDVTVCVDSATVGDNNFFLLLRVSGMQFSDRYGYGFDQVIVDIEPDPVFESSGIGSYGFQYLGVDGDGSILLLLDYSYTSGMGNVKDTRPIDITLTLENLLQSPHVDREKKIAEGSWNFEFSLERRKMEAIQLPETEVLAMNLWTQKLSLVTISNLELTSTGLFFQYDYAEGTYSIESEISVILNNGESISSGGGSGTPLEDGRTLNCSCQWPMPVDLNEVASVRIGETQIDVTHN